MDKSQPGWRRFSDVHTFRKSTPSHLPPIPHTVHESGRRFVAGVFDIEYLYSLLQLKLSRFDRALILVPNSCEFLVIQMACARIGVFALFMKYGASPEEVSLMASKYKCAAIIVQTYEGKESYGRSVVNACQRMEPDRNVRLIVCVDFDGGPKTSQYRALLGSDPQYLSESDESAVRAAQAQVQMEDPMVGTLTSGTTGEPKVVSANHFQSILRAFCVGERCLINTESRYLNERPFSWVGGLLLGVLPVSVVGITLVSMDPEISVKKADTQLVMKILQDERCTHFLAMPYMMHDFIHCDVAHHFDLSNLKYAFTGGQPIMKEMVENFLKKHPQMQLLQGYGSSENTSVSTQTRTTDTINDPGFGYLELAPDFEAKIVGEDDRIVARGVMGELWLRSAMHVTGYLDNPEATARAFTPLRWFKTGDMMVMDEQGHIRPVGRVADSIKRATVLIQPAEIENVLVRHSKVSEVFVVGVPDERLYEELCACIKLNAGDTSEEADLQEIELWCGEIFLPGPDGLTLAPRYFLSFKDFPKTTTGKLNRRELAAEATKILGLN
ncbi:acyl-CoA synthetase family member 2, mitochondrial isoform X2 [Lingula anatina]|uniref:Acyl-CoA synthetase family member 2, mitochondrial isoform X2 n=1 Tax=Lingula anatina TaxID=7574 RepID=A0A1S3GY46_LINAN|nr:acyl-CoA synthetase family member 2, mitochondrial isoform X2 [Lingula anatina]|eukprot:XP_013378795.1 acyl-CoA synthetase family member 2, mitochondrial isoform X2 [Lingula anatina]